MRATVKAKAMAVRDETGCGNAAGGEAGQAATEYAIVVAYSLFFVLGAYWGIQLLEAALIGFYRDTALVLCLPFP